MSSVSFNSRCSRISSSNSRSNLPRRTSIPARRQISLILFIPSLSSSFALLPYFIASVLCRLNHSPNRLNHAFELRLLDLQLLSARDRQAVVARAAILRGRPPLRFHPALDQHPLQRGI